MQQPEISIHPLIGRLRRRVLTNGDDYIIIVNKFFNRNRQNVEDYRFREAQTLHGSNPCT